MAFGLHELIGGIAGKRIVAVAGIFIAVAIVAGSIAGLGKDTSSRKFLAYIDREIIAEDPFAKDSDHLAEFRTGHWSWELTQVINAYSRYLEPGETLASLLERNFKLVAEHRRHRESDGPMTDRAYKINRYHLDPHGTDHMQVYENTTR